MSGHTDLSVATESEDSDAYETDNTEPERARTRSRGTEERRRREVRRRVEDRIKPDENSEVDDEKDGNDELPRRTRRLRRTVKKIDKKEETGLFADETDEPEENEEDLEDEPEENGPPDGFEKTVTHEDTPKGRDFDLNQIRSELKGFDKAVKMEVIRMDPEQSGDEEVKPKIEELDKEIKEDVKEIKKEQESDIVPIVEEIVKTPVSPSPTTEDVYEFKEPEPFEFEVRNKRDSGSDKDKIGIKKRVFDEEPKSPKKKQKTIPIPPKEIKQETVILPPIVPILEESKKKPKRSPVIKRPEEDSIETVIKSPTKEIEKIEAKSVVSSYVPEESIKPAPIDLLFTDLPANEETQDADDTDDRLVISEMEVLEVEKKIVGYQSSYGESETIEPKKDEKKIELPSTSKEKEEKPLIPVIPPLVPSVLPMTVLSATSTIERKLLETKGPIIVPSAPIVPVPISARLPATSTIEEKLSAAAMAFRQQKPKEMRKEEESCESKRLKDSMKKTEIKRGKQEIDQSKSKPEDKKKEEETFREEIVKVIKKEEEDVKLRKETVEKITERRIIEKRQIDPLKEISESAELEKQKRKKILSQEFLDSTDSSDSEQKLVIDNPEEKCEKIVKIEKAEVFDAKIPSEPESLPIDQKILTAVVVKHEEEGENMNLLCEEEIPGSPAPAMEVVDQEETPARGSSKEKLEKKIVILEMPFASAPTSGAQSTSQGGLSMTVASCGVQGGIGHGLMPGRIVQAQVQVAAVGLQVIPNRRESNEAAPVMENTPPTTPDSTISNVSGSPREERPGGSPTSEDNGKREEESEEVKNNFGEGLEETVEINESSNLVESSKSGMKRPVEDPGTPKKRKRNRKSSECGKEKKGTRSGRLTRHGAGGSDSDDTSEGSNTGGASIGGGTEGVINGIGEALGRDQKPLKYNFYVDLDPELDGCQRIALLQQKLLELKKTYNLVKTELAAIERRRKKLRRREREAKKLSIAAMKAAKAEMQQACA